MVVDEDQVVLVEVVAVVAGEVEEGEERGAFHEKTHGEVEERLANFEGPSAVQMEEGVAEVVVVLEAGYLEILHLYAQTPLIHGRRV
jgi:hypothetical protein